MANLDIDALFCFWAQWQLTGNGGSAWSVEYKHDPIYVGAQPIPDAALLAEDALGYMSQTQRGKLMGEIIKQYYLHYNSSKDITMKIVRKIMGKPDMSQTMVYNHIGLAKELAKDAVDRVMSGQRADVKRLLRLDHAV